MPAMKPKKTPARKGPAAKKTASEGPVDPAFQPVVDAFAGQKDVSRARRFSTSSVLSVKGKIFAMMVKGRFVAKLPRERVDDIVSAGFGVPFEPGPGRVMKEWVSVDTKGPPWIELAREAHRFVKTGKR
jgi:hypothetical protein